MYVNLKWKFEKIPFIKKLSEKNEIFIQYFGEKRDHYAKNYFSYTTIRIPNYDKYIVMDYEAFEANEEDVGKVKEIKIVQNNLWYLTGQIL